MKKFGELLSAARKKKRISLDHASRDLVIKKIHLEALEEENWTQLPESPYVQGYIKSYAKYLSLNPDYLVAIYRREYDETKFPKKPAHKFQKRFFITPNKLLNSVFAIGVIIFITYIIIQYSSVFSSPKLEITSPQNDETISVPAIKISGKTEKDATVSINGHFAPIDESGNFNYEYILNEGKNNIEIISSFRLSPKNKVTRTIRLIR